MSYKHLTRPLASLLPLLFCTATLLAEDSPKTAPAGAGAESIIDREETIVIGGVPMSGKPVLPATEMLFRFKLSLTGDVVELRWADLEENERKRMQKVYGLEVRGEQRVFGDKIKGTRFTLETGRTVEGLPIPERNRPGQIAVRTAQTPLMHIPERDIRAKEEYEAYESEFYSAREIYEGWILKSPPGINDAAAHFTMSERAAKIGMYAKALEHLESAVIIDPRMAERTADFKMELIRADADQQVRDMFNRMITTKRGGNYFEAWDILERLDRNFPNHDWKSRWESLRAEIEQGVKTDLTKKVIFLSYSIARDLVQEKFYKKIRVDEKGNVVPSIPGKQVTTRAGHAFRGVLVSGGEGGADMVLKVNDVELTIAGKDVVAVRDVDLSKSAKEIEPTYEQLKEYVTGTGPDGLKGDMLARIAKLTKQPESKIKEIFDGRLKQSARYEGGNYEADPRYVSLHDANYGISSWLRDGARPGPIPQNPNAQQPRQTRIRVNGQNITLNNNQNQAQQPNPDEDPNLTDDPEVWWKFQSNDTRLNALRCLMAEKVFKKKDDKVTETTCLNCRGQKNLLVNSPTGTLEPIRCNQCRGIGVWYKFIYQ